MDRVSLNPSRPPSLKKGRRSTNRLLYLILRKVIRDPQRLEYNDLAITPVLDDETETRELFQSAEAHAYVVKIQRVEKLQQGTAA